MSDRREPRDPGMVRWPRRRPRRAALLATLTVALGVAVAHAAGASRTAAPAPAQTTIVTPASGAGVMPTPGCPDGSGPR